MRPAMEKLGTACGEPQVVAVAHVDEARKVQRTMTPDGFTMFLCGDHLAEAKKKGIETGLIGDLKGKHVAGQTCDWPKYGLEVEKAPSKPPVVTGRSKK